MKDMNIAFCRHLLRMVRADLTPAQRRELKGSWVYGYQRGAGDWEFQVTEGDKTFYWNGEADNAYDARYKGISAWLEKYYPQHGEGQ